MTKPLPLYPSDVIPVEVKKIVKLAGARQRGAEERTSDRVHFLLNRALVRRLLPFFSKCPWWWRSYTMVGRLSIHGTQGKMEGDDAPRALIARVMTPATPTRPMVAKKTFRP